MSDMQFLTDQDRKTIDTWVAKFPSENKKSAVLMALRTVQDRVGYLTDEHMEAVAQYLSIPQIAVYEVASFYRCIAGHLLVSVSLKFAPVYHAVY